MDTATQVDDFASLVTAAKPLHSSFLTRSLESMREDARAELTGYLNYCRSVGLSLEYLADSYNTIVRDTFREEMFFHENKRYHWSRFDELAHSVYFDDAVTFRMWGKRRRNAKTMPLPSTWVMCCGRHRPPCGLEGRL
jgi:hypothetical protein